MKGGSSLRGPDRSWVGRLNTSRPGPLPSPTSVDWMGDPTTQLGPKIPDVSPTVGPTGLDDDMGV